MHVRQTSAHFLPTFLQITPIPSSLLPAHQALEEPPAWLPEAWPLADRQLERAGFQASAERVRGARVGGGPLPHPHRVRLQYERAHLLLRVPRCLATRRLKILLDAEFYAANLFFFFFLSTCIFITNMYVLPFVDSPWCDIRSLQGVKSNYLQLLDLIHLFTYWSSKLKFSINLLEKEKNGLTGHNWINYTFYSIWGKWNSTSVLGFDTKTRTITPKLLKLTGGRKCDGSFRFVLNQYYVLPQSKVVIVSVFFSWLLMNIPLQKRQSCQFGF